MFKFTCLYQKKKLLLFNLSLLFITNEATPISATSLKSIQGSAPYIIFEGKILQDLNPLLAVTLPLPPNGDITTLNIDTESSAQNPIILASEIKVSDIKTFVKLPPENYDYPKIPIKKITNLSFVDKDEDVIMYISNNDYLMTTWYDNEGLSLVSSIHANPDMKLDPCMAPFHLNVYAYGTSFQTEYGNPSIKGYPFTTHNYYFSPQVPSGVKFCYAQPNLNNQDNVDTDSWKKNKGFVTYDKNNPENNFPTTGANNLFFDIKLAGLTVDDIIRINGTNVTPISGNGISLVLSKKDGKLRVTLKGPTYTSTNTSFNPATFKLYADNAKNTAFYSFKIQRWYIGFENASNDYSETLTRCQKLKYDIPDVRDFTNSNREKDRNGIQIDWKNGISGVKEVYRRKISYKQSDGQWMGGLFSEWGTVTNQYYKDSDWSNDTTDTYNVAYYWTKNIKDLNDHYVVESTLGYVGNRGTNDVRYYTGCVSKGTNN
ncbi:hypothetical protein FcAc13_05735 [Frischella sp. Ac13]|uniref:Uncharacterized protein n=1 Tax=Frischella japonica TaxID=2741544 RepID=A0ABR7QX57_9GAMM|nr:hypothetical protein [Frischella japonica]MBC9130808.1 hypothetical protein [Frischella japonica]